MPDTVSIIEEMITEGDKVVVRSRMSGTYIGETDGSSSAGKRVTISMVMIERIAHGKIVEEWAWYDTYGFMKQLGLVPAPQQKK